MGGRKSPDFQEYQRQCVQALLVARKHAKQVKNLMEIMTYHSSYPAFRYLHVSPSCVCVGLICCWVDSYAVCLPLMVIMYSFCRYNPHAIEDFMGRLLLELPDQKIEAQVAAMMAR